jgi:hypothetical protein
MMASATAMRDAFEKAGFKPPESAANALKWMMREAIAAGGGKADPSRDYFIAALSSANDPALLWELFAPVRVAVIGRLFTETLIEMRGETALKDAKDAAGMALPQGQRLDAASLASNTGAGAVNRMPQGQSGAAPAPAPQNPSRLRYEAAERVARLSILRTFKINGQALADVTGAEARAWLKNHQRDGRFVSLVSYQVPDEMKISAIVPEDEADRLFKLATDAGNA